MEERRVAKSLLRFDLLVVGGRGRAKANEKRLPALHHVLHALGSNAAETADAIVFAVAFSFFVDGGGRGAEGRDAGGDRDRIATERSA